jgi:hypothetical protein
MGGDRSLMAFFHHSSFSGSRLHHKENFSMRERKSKAKRQAGRQIWLKETKRKGKKEGGGMDQDISIVTHEIQKKNLQPPPI